MKLMDILNEGTSNKTFTHKISNGNMVIEIESGPAGTFLDIMVNRQHILEVDMQYPSGDVKVNQTQYKLKDNT